MGFKGNVACMEGMKNIFKNSVERPLWKRLFRSPNHTRQTNIKIDPKEIKQETADWKDLPK
jgi:hypothetical protein